MKTIFIGIVSAVRWLLAPVRRKWTFYGLAFLALLAAWGTFRHYRSKAIQAAVEADASAASVVVLERARGADGAALAKSEGARQALRVKEAKANADTETALRQNPAWADERVPVDVLSSLRD